MDQDLRSLFTCFSLLAPEDHQTLVLSVPVSSEDKSFQNTSKARLSTAQDDRMNPVSNRFMQESLRVIKAVMSYFGTNPLVTAGGCVADGETGESGERRLQPRPEGGGQHQSGVRSV